MKKLLFLAFLFASTLGFAEGLKPGDKAVDFKLKNVDGKYVSLSDFDKAKGYILIFTCNGCPYAIAYEDRIIELDKEFKSKGYPVIAINPNSPEAKPADSFEKMVERSKDKGFTFPYLVDADQSVYKEYGASVTPHVFILTKSGKKMEVAYVGTIDNNYKDAAKADKHYVKDVVNSLLAGNSPKVTETKAIGCGIK